MARARLTRDWLGSFYDLRIGVRTPDDLFAPNYCTGLMILVKRIECLGERYLISVRRFPVELGLRES